MGFNAVHNYWQGEHKWLNRSAVVTLIASLITAVALTALFLTFPQFIPPFPSELFWPSFVVVALFMVTLPTILFFITIGLPARKVENCHSTPPQKRVPQHQKMDDFSIIENLKKQGWREPIPTTADGRCLFHSIAPQIIEADFAEAKNHFPDIKLCTFEEWKTLGTIDRADSLRAWAMEVEKIFFQSLPEDLQQLSEDEKDWVNELYKDSLQELSRGKRTDQLRQKIKAAVDKEKFDFCKNNFHEYQERTARTINFAGTTELIALARLFNRQVIIFGQDHISSESVSLEDDVVLPYYQRLIGSSPPLAIFQTGGGGHYKSLLRK